MSNSITNDNDQSAPLVDYFAVYGPSRFRKPNGKPMGRRSLQKKILKFDLPIIRTGWGSLIDPVAGDARLRQFARQPPDREPRGRGRPKRESDPRHSRICPDPSAG
jgi:hypothetical protein